MQYLQAEYEEELDQQEEEYEYEIAHSQGLLPVFLRYLQFIQKERIKSYK